MRPALMALGGFIAGFAMLQLVVIQRTSATWDEPAHLTAGYAAVAHGDYRIDPAHPPLARMWVALPLLFDDDVRMNTDAIRQTPMADWITNGRAYPFAREFLYRDNDADRLLRASRRMNLALGALLGVLVFAWAYQWLGLGASMLALALFALSPNLAAHASLVTTDVGVACFSFGAVFFLWSTCRKFAILNIGATAVFFALAVTTKYSALLLAPAAFAMLTYAVRVRALSWRQAGIVSAATLSAIVVAIWAVYGFRYAPSPDGWELHIESIPQLRERAPLIASMAAWADYYRLLPNAFTQGILLLQVSSVDTPAYLAGEIRTNGWWYYFPFAFLIKTPLALIGLAAGGLWWCARKKWQDAPAPWVFILTAVATFVGIAMFSGFNIGVRHILPAFPFVLLLAAAGAQALANSSRPMAKPVLIALLVFGTVEYARAYPQPLTFFNQLVGGPRNGYRYLADSNLGWGQNLKPLKRWMDANGVTHVNLAYFGQADPAYYGIDHVVLPGSSVVPELVTKPRLPGYVAISGTVLTGVYLHPVWRLFYRPFLEMEPADVLGNTMRIYWVNKWPVATTTGGADSPDLPASVGLGLALSEAVRWPELASEYFAAADRMKPGDPTIRTLLEGTLSSRQ